MNSTSLPLIRVGSLVVARRATAVCDVGEKGVCYEVYELGDRPGWSVIFERGRYDGFAPDEVALFLDVTGAVCDAVADYAFTNVNQLRLDFQQGRFRAAFHVKPPAPAGAIPSLPAGRDRACSRSPSMNELTGDTPSRDPAKEPTGWRQCGERPTDGQLVVAYFLNVGEPTYLAGRYDAAIDEVKGIETIWIDLADPGVLAWYPLPLPPATADG